MNPILIPLRNGLALTRAAHATFTQQDIPVEIMYINNASSDGTMEWLTTLSGAYCIHNAVPMSVAQSWNAGLAFYFGRGAEHVLVVNNDVLLRPDTYRLLIEHGGGFVTAVGNHDKDCIKNLTLPTGKPRPTPDYSCFLIRREVWKKVPFDEEYKGAYCEDSEHHLALHKAGINAVCIDLPFYHLGAGTMKGMTEAEQQELHDTAHKNRVLFEQRHGVVVGTPEYYALFGELDPNLPQNQEPKSPST